MVVHIPFRTVAVLAVLLLASTPQAAHADLVIFETDFESGVPTAFSGMGQLTGTQGYSALGFQDQFLRNTVGNGLSNGITLSLTGLPTHTAVSLDFALAVIDSWDGAGDFSNGPDGLTVAIDGVPLFAQVFENSGSGTQTYIASSGVTLARHANLGFASPGPSGFFRDSAYDMGLDSLFDNIAHTGDSLTISWFRHSGSQINGSISVPVDESWAIDNVQVALLGTSAVPEPTSLALSSMALIGFAAMQRRRTRRQHNPIA